jgi:hypothetical protein
MEKLNDRYGKNLSDAKYVERVISDAQDTINMMQADESIEYSEDGAKDVIMNWLDKLGIYPDDVDHVFSELKF